MWNYYEMFRLPTYGLDELKHRLRVEGTEHAEELLRAGRSAIFVFPHIGNLELLMQIPVLYPQYRFFILVERMGDERLFRLMHGLRSSQGLQVVAATEVMRITRLLRDGWSLILAGDFDSTGSGIVVDFFGAPARMPDGAVRLSRSTTAPLIIVNGWRDPTDPTDPTRAGQVRSWVPPSHPLRLLPPLQLPRTNDPREDARRGVEVVIKRLEPFIAAHLDQWLAFHPFWTEVTN
jgi:KDO2-lipid IV(A) lauroyltransferase